MRNYFNNKIKERLSYCLDWKYAVDIYLEGREISKKTNQEYYKSRFLLKFILKIYFLPLNSLKFFRHLCMLHEYKKNEVEIKILNDQLRSYENKKR
tara:strand:- start:3835 stop:4122 length:288 start_codon:yes stop_codon:yes gene_type:complete